MLGRLDDKLDELSLQLSHHEKNDDTADRAEHTCQYKHNNNTSLTPLMDRLEHNTLCNKHEHDISSTAPHHVPDRIPLSSLISELVSSWSRAFIDLATDGDTSSMTLVAQMYLNADGWGSISYNREEGIKWLICAIEGGDIEARSMLQRIDKQRYIEYVEQKLGRKMNEADEENDKKLIEKQRNEIENIHGT